MPPLSGRASGPAALAVVFGSLLSVGCVNTDEKKEPLILGSDARSRLTTPNDPNSPKTARAASFDPAVTGGTGVTKENSFARTTPGPGTGTGNFAGPLPPPQLGQTPVVTAPPKQGASFGEPQTEPGRSAMASRQPAAPPPLPPPALPTGKPADIAPSSPFGPAPPKLDPPLNDPPVQQTKFDSIPTPAPIPPVLPNPDRPAPGSLPLPVPDPTAKEPLPIAPPAPGFVPSPTEAPIPGVQPPPKLRPAPPILPDGR